MRFLGVPHISKIKKMKIITRTIATLYLRGKQLKVKCLKVKLQMYRGLKKDHFRN